ncbi:hypothetical protein [Streptomyces sp. NPDC053048]|uniref:hypothetical protein n=1 Tax=Streptomyces sp. NPDC053048 TaxID=3365694 RepID=UPI0037D446C4
MSDVNDMSGSPFEDAAGQAVSAAARSTGFLIDLARSRRHGPADTVVRTAHTASEADAARALAAESRGRAEEFAGRGDTPAAEAAAVDGAELEGVAAERDKSAGELRAEAANSYSVTAPGGPARDGAGTTTARPGQAPAQAPGQTRTTAQRTTPQRTGTPRRRP